MYCSREEAYQALNVLEQLAILVACNLSQIGLIVWEALHEPNEAEAHALHCFAILNATQRVLA